LHANDVGEGGAVVRTTSKSGKTHVCEQCKKRGPWGPGWGYLIGPIPSELPGESHMPVRWCSDACEDAWFVAHGYSVTPLKKRLAMGERT
jgi:hypothetical protein